MKKSLKERMRKGEFTVGSWITLGHTSVAEVMAQAGFDWLVVDMEHSAITLAEAQRLVQVIELSGVAPLIRVNKNDPALIKQAMDTGAHGVIVPMVNTARDAQQAVAAVNYPPLGNRGVGLARAQKYGFGFEGYKKWSQKESVVIVQVEHKDAVDNFEEIMDVPGVDGFFVGPYDLSGSLGVPGNFSHPLVKKYLMDIRKKAKLTKAVAGLHVIKPDVKEFLEKKAQGYKFLAFSLDTLLLGSACCQVFRNKINGGAR